MRAKLQRRQLDPSSLYSSELKPSILVSFSSELQLPLLLHIPWHGILREHLFCP
uniref:Uncharacterized protein n=1 Tax=Setaria italica TaxID=4555 RepID=K4A406_SETIT